MAQLQALPLDPSGNAERTCEAVAAAAADGADLVILPELAGSGYVLEDGLPDAAEPGDGSGPVLTAWREAAARLGVAIVGGFAERDGDRLYNAAAIIDRRGRLLGRYRKLHLFGDERRHFAPGDLGLPIFELDGVRVGVLVCYDLRFPEAMRLLALEGAELIAVPTAWVGGFDPDVDADGGRLGQVEGALVQANLNQVHVACADLCGSIAGRRFLGSSVIASPYGEPLAGPLGTVESGTAMAAVDRDETLRAQRRADGISPRADRRTDVYSLARARSGTAVPDGDVVLAEIERRRGYVLPLHRTLARLDPSFLASYDAYLGATFLTERTLDRQLKELVYVGVLTALATPSDHLVTHMRAAVDHGASERQVLEVLEQVLTPAGVPRFIEGVAAFERAFPDWSDR